MDPDPFEPSQTTNFKCSSLISIIRMGIRILPVEELDAGFGYMDGSWLPDGLHTLVDRFETLAQVLNIKIITRLILFYYW